MGHPTMQENDTAKLTPTPVVLLIGLALCLVFSVL